MLLRATLFALKTLTLVALLTLHSFAASQSVSLRLQWKHQFEFAGFYAAKEQGYYQAAGLDVEILEFENGVDIVSEVTSGDVEFGLWGSGIIEHGMRNEPIVMLANYFKRSPLALATKPNITFPSELEGKTLMVSDADRKSANYTQMFETFNVDISKINFVPPSFDVEDLATGAVDGISIFLTNESYLLNKRGIPHNIIDPNNFGVDLYDGNLFTSRAYAEAEPLLVKAFIEASNKGWEYALENPEQIIDLIQEKYNSQQKSRDHLLYEAQQTARMIQPKSFPIGSIDLDKVKSMGYLFTQAGLTDANWTTSFVYQEFEPEVALTPEEIAYVRSRSDVSVAMMPDFTPFSFVDAGETKGFEHDLLALLNQKTGLRFTPQYGIWNQGLSAFKSGSVDMIASISYNEERTPFTLFTSPYYEIPIMIYVRDDFGVYRGLEDLKGKRVGILRDVFYASDLEALGTLDLVIFETYEQLTKALVYGQVDALMQNLTNIDSLIKENAYTTLRLAGELKLPTIQREDLRFGVRSDDPILRDIIQKGMDGISVDEMKSLTNTWLGIKPNETARSVHFSPQEEAYLRTKGAIKMCVDPAWLPLEAIDSATKHVGISAEILATAAANTGLNLQLYPTTSWQQTLDSVRDRKCDLISLAMKTEARAEYLDFTLPYLTFPFVIATTDRTQFIDNLSLMNGRKLAMIQGYSAIDLIAEQYPEIEIVEVASLQAGIAMVRNDEVAGYVDALPALATAIKEEGMTDIYIAGKLDQEFTLSVATRNDEPILLSVMQKGLNSVPPETIQSINNRWLAIRFESHVDYSLLYKVIGVFALLGLLGIWRHRVIQRTNRLIEEKNQQLEMLAMTDMLTGVFNRHRIDAVLNEQLELARRYRAEFAVVLIDIDHFKQVNDTHGHGVGDSTLVSFANILREHTRSTDFVGRWGGEEFLIVVPQAQKVDLTQFAENIRAAIESHNFDSVESVTASLGVAVHRNGESVNEVVSRADDALYESKQNGRNRVTLAALKGAA